MGASVAAGEMLVEKANAKADFSATQRTVILCAAPVEMTHLSLVE
jgi:hypothetical protein